jgi:hypothetical protein
MPKSECLANCCGGEEGSRYRIRRRLSAIQVPIRVGTVVTGIFVFCRTVNACAVTNFYEDR